MKLKPKKPKYKNKYTIEFSWMSGDADSYEEKELLLKNDNALEVMKALKKLCKPGEYFEPKQTNKDDGAWETGVPIIDELIQDEWPWDRYAEEGKFPASLESYCLYYYDEDGRRVEMELSK